MPCPPRETTLDRYAQHTQSRPDSRCAVRNAKALRLLSWAAAATIAAGRVARLGSVARAAAQPRGPRPRGARLRAGARSSASLRSSTSAPTRDRDLRKIPKVAFADERLDGPHVLAFYK